MKELIVALKACLQIAVMDAFVTEDQAAIVGEHINSLEDATIRNDAMGYVQKMRNSSTYKIPHDTAAGALAKVCVMLTLYGSKPDAMLAVLHDKGWEVITLADVEAVRKFILEQ